MLLWHCRMHEYDVAFKLLLQQSVDVTIRELVGTTVARWLSVPDVLFKAENESNR